MENVLTVQDLEVGFDLPSGQVMAVRGVSFRVPARSTVALVGESGSGKTVVSQAIMRILPSIGEIKAGHIWFRDPGRARSGESGEDQGGALAAAEAVDIAALPRDGKAMRAIRGGRVAVIFQEPMSALSPVHTVGDQVSEALRLHRKVDGATGRELSIAMLRLVGFPNPEGAYNAYPFELSGGLRQRAMISMALVCRPALLIADEPTTALDVTIQAQILGLLRELQAELGMAVLMITHDLGVVANIADEVVVMYHGRVVESGAVADLFANPGHPYLRALLRAVPRFDRAPGERLVPIRDYPRADATRLMAARAAPIPNGRSTSAASVEPLPPGALLDLKGVGKSYQPRRAGLFGARGKPFRAVASVDLTLTRGECLGLVGESGCGKTTLSKIIMRAIDADVGVIRYDADGGAVDVRALTGPALKAYRRRVQFIFQDPFGSLNPRMTVHDLIAEPLVIHEIGDAEERKATVAELLRLVGLDPRHMSRYPHSFSGGQRQRIGIARALALKPDLVICDEPVSALDVSVQAQILNLLTDLKAELGLTYLFISHNLAVVDYVADRVAVMCAGRIVEFAARADLFREPLHPYTRALLAAVPTAELGRPLDFRLIANTRASDPTAWPPPFRVADAASDEPGLIEVTPGHWVRAEATLLGARLAS